MTLYSLHDRVVVSLSGSDTVAFLERLLTCSLAPPAAGTVLCRLAALLTPQGKIRHVFIVWHCGQALYLETGRTSWSDLENALARYRLRADVNWRLCPEMRVLLRFKGEETPAPQLIQPVLEAPFPECQPLACRLLLGCSPEDSRHLQPLPARLLLQHRLIAHDKAWQGHFPADVLLDHFGGVDYHKGCFIGQEVVSRMKRRGTQKKILTCMLLEGVAPLDPETPITQQGRRVATLVDRDEDLGLLLLRPAMLREAVPLAWGKKAIFIPQGRVNESKASHPNA